MALVLLLTLAVVMGTGSAKPAYAAATITVNTTSDEAVTDGKCSLREAINNANANADTEVFPLMVLLPTVSVPLFSMPPPN